MDNKNIEFIVNVSIKNGHVKIISDKKTIIRKINSLSDIVLAVELYLQRIPEINC